MKQLVLGPAVAGLLLLAACGSSSADEATAAAETSTTVADPGTDSTLVPAGPDELGISVNDTELTVAEFEQQLDSWATLAESSGETVRAGDGYIPDFVASVTDQYIRFQSFVDQLAVDGIEITADDVTQAEATAATDLAVLDEDDPARVLAVNWIAGLAAVEPSAAELDAYVALHADELATDSVCSSHILVESKDEADAVASRLADGEQFADLAKELSIDPGSGAAGGDLGCVSLGAFVAEYEQAALQAEIGTVTDPVESDFGFHLILTRDASTDDLLPIATAKIAQENTARVEGALENATVQLAPQFGTWDATTHVYTPPTS